MRYGTTDVLKGIDLTVTTGEVMCLLGPNGAGKSTTIEILEGFRNRSAGEVRVLGADPADADGVWRNRIGVVQQSWRDHATWKVADLIRHFARYYTNPYSADELLDLVGLSAKAGQRLATLSGGQRRRLDVALGIIGRPELLFLDEPTAGFDPQARRTFHDLIATMRNNTGMSVVLTTHDMAEAERLADTVAILIAGRIRVCGALDELTHAVTEKSLVRWTAPDGTRCEENTAEPEKLVYELTRTFDGPIPGLQVIRPTLEDTYLALVREQETT
ncbi:ABC transporter ATP-binding protein [Streptomyces sp. ISL-11]|nr:ABC transporter ATP-binding protein [Streptomyces sp. ISL-11]